MSTQSKVWIQTLRGRLCLGVGLLVLAALFPVPVAAQSGDVDSLVADYEVDDSEPASGPLPEGSSSIDSAELKWRVWQQSLTQKGSKLEQLAQTRRLAVSLGYRNALKFVWPTVAELQGTQPASPGDARAVFHETALMAPDAPYPALAQASYMWQHHPSEVPSIVKPYLDGLERVWTWLPVRYALFQLGLLALAVGVALAAFSFALGQICRHVPVTAHDAARLLPAGFTRGQIMFAVFLGAAAAGLYFGSPLVAGVALLAFGSVTQRLTERIGTVLVAGAIAAVPAANSLVERAETFPTSSSYDLFRAQYERCDADCLDDLASRVEKGENAEPVTTYTLALAELRHGGAASLDRAVERLREVVPLEGAGAGWGRNLLGAALVAADEPEEAIDELEQAASTLEGEVAPIFNLVRAYQRAGQVEQADRALARATSSNLDTVRRKRNVDRRDPASWLILEPLPPGPFVEAHAREDHAAPTAIRVAWDYAAGTGIPIEWAYWFAAFLAGAALVGWPIRLAGVTSYPCPNCGLAREPKDPERTSGDPHCLPCYRTYMGGAQLTYQTRTRYEELLGRHEKAQSVLRRLFSIVPPGAGHALAGRVTGALLVPLCIGAGLVLGLDPGWSWTPPDMLVGRDWFGYRILGWFLVGTAGLRALFAAKNDLVVVEDLDEEVRRG